MPRAHVYENLPESVGELPAILHWLPGGNIPWPRDVTYNLTHSIDVRVFFSRANAPTSDAQAKPWIEKLRKAIDKDPKLQDTAFNSGVTGYRYGEASYAGVTYLMLSITVQAIEKIIAGEVQS